MAYPVDNIITVNMLLTPAGLGYGDFSTALVFADEIDLKSNNPSPFIQQSEDGETFISEEGDIFGAMLAVDRRVVFPVDTYRDYSSIKDVATDFLKESDIYQIATRFFANIPKPSTLTVWMRDPEDDIIEALNKADDSVWRYNYFLKADYTTEPENAIALADWGDASNHPIWCTFSDENILDANIKTDIMSILKSKGNRHMFAGYKTAESIELDPSQKYSMAQLAAAFNKFKPDGLQTAITGEYQVLPGVIGDDLKTSDYNALKAKNAVFFTKIELQGQTDNSRVINSKSMSSYVEYIDDVINLDVLKNHLQVDGYNYIANAGTKRALTPRDYSGLLSVLKRTCKRFYDNGVLGTGSYTDLDTGEDKVADFGFVFMSAPEDVLKLNSADRKKRRYPSVSLLVILARAGHVVEINCTVE